MPENWDDPNVLLRRSTAGLVVEVAYLPITELVTLNVRCGDEVAAHTVPPEKALDAFHHPVLYLAPQQVEALGIR